MRTIALTTRKGGSGKSTLAIGLTVGAMQPAATLNAIGVLALPYMVQRTDHQDAMGAGLAVSDYAPSGKAANEVRALWTWVKHKLDDESESRMILHGMGRFDEALAGHCDALKRIPVIRKHSQHV
jgi:cellulose biosynthesis protein BcsQ